MDKLKYLVLLIALLPFSAQCDTVQWSKGYLANCDNPVERVDGTALAISEIARVEYYLSTDDLLAGKERTELTGVVYTVLMSGGCSSSYVDTKRISVGTYYAYAVAFDTDARESVASVNHEIVVQKARPKSATGLRIDAGPIP